MIKKKYIKRTKADKDFIKKKIFKLGLTFCSKFIIKLTSKIIIPDLYLYILKFQTVNRSNEDLEKILSKIKQLTTLNSYLKYPEEKKSNIYYLLIKEIAKISFHKKNKKFEIVKKVNEDINKFIYILNGSLCKLNLTFVKEKISIEEYLIYLIKMKLLHEDQILNKCSILNKSYIDLDINNFQNFFEQNKEYNYKQLKLRAKKELNSQGIKFTNNKKNNKNKIEIESIEKYINISKFQTEERNDTETRFNLFIGKYIKIKTLEKGEFIGDLSTNENKEGFIYISENSSDIAFINKNETINSMLYKNMYEKYKKIFENKIPKFFIFKDLINYNFEKNIFPFLIYKHYLKGENIILQNSQYEGVYFILDGKIKITVNKTFNELANTLISLQYSIFNFKDYVSKIIKTVDILNEFHIKYMLNKKKLIDVGENKIKVDVLSSNEYMDFLKGIKKIEFYEMGIGDILGLNELFDFKTELFNFNAFCVSDEAHLFFLDKKYFNNLIEKEGTVMNNVIKLIDLKTKILMGKINNFRISYSKGVLNKIKNKKIENKKLNDNNNSIIMDENNKNETSMFRTFRKFNFGKIKEKKIKIKNSNNVKLFKNNELLIYLQNSKKVRNNSLSDTFNLNIGEVLSNNNKYLSPHFSRNHSFLNINQEKNLRHNFSQINLNSNLNPNTIIYERNINHLGDGGDLLINVFENQKRYDEFKKENFYKSEYINNNSNNSMYINKELLPVLKKDKSQRNKKNGNIKRIFGRTMSFKFLNNINNSSNLFEN